MKCIKKLLNRIFIDGLTGMAQGLFATLIVGTILQQIGTLIGGNIGANGRNFKRAKNRCVKIFQAPKISHKFV